MAGPGLPAYWVIDHRDGERLLQALAVSLVLHIVILGINLPRRPASHVAGDTAMQVTLSSARDAFSAALQLPAKETPAKQAREILQQTAPSDIALSRKQKKQATQDHAAAQRATKADASPQAGTGSDQAGGAESRYVHKPGEARVILEINDDGRIGQIIWDLLPALTDDQFNRLEAAIRARGHPGPTTNGFVRETIDVRDYIGTTP